MGDDPVRCLIPDILKKIGKNQSWLADQIDLSRQEISDICKMREKRVVSLRKGRKIALTLKCKIDDLYEWK